MGNLSCSRGSAALTSTTTSKHHLRIFSDEELKSATSNFSPSAFLGRGSHGSVFLASLNGGSLLAAAKIPSETHHTDGEIDILRSLPVRIVNLREIDILRSFPRRIPRIVNLLGHTESKIAVVEFMPGGSLDNLLRSPRQPTWRRRVSLALDAAEGVAALHCLNPPVVHRDIKPSNILLDANGRARIGDFGLAVRLPAEEVPPPAAGTMGYIDPAYVSPADVSTRVDVYSFGVLLLEILSGRRAIDVDLAPPSVVDWAVGLMDGGMYGDLWDPRATGDGWAAREVAELARRCVSVRAEERPCMAEVAGNLRWVDRRARSSPMLTWQRLAGRVWGGNRSRNHRVSDDRRDQYLTLHTIPTVSYYPNE